MGAQLVLSFDAVDVARACAAAELARLLPSLVPEVRACDVGVDARTRRIRVRAWTDGAVAARSAQRLAFWAARAGGRARAPASAPEEELFELALGRCQRVHRDADVLRVFAAIRAEFPPDPGVPVLTPMSSSAPVLQLSVDGPAFEGVTYDPRARLLFVPSPLSPAVGDEFVLQLDAPAWHAGAVRARAMVVDVRSQANAAPAEPAGFRVTVGGGRAHALLVERCPNPLATDRTRAAQRYRMFGRVQVRDAGDATGPARDGYLRDLSMGGAFICTDLAAAPGERVELDAALPNAAVLRTGATIVHSRAEGIGVEFERAADDGSLAAAITNLSGRAPRVLLVDDDALARAMLAHAFRGEGWDVLTASDASVGLQMLTEELFALDLLVTDVRMEGLDGAEFVHSIRRLGGENDLPIVVVTGTVTETLERTMRALGADAVVSKSIGPEATVRVANAAVEARRGSVDGEEASA